MIVCVCVKQMQRRVSRKVNNDMRKNYFILLKRQKEEMDGLFSQGV